MREELLAAGARETVVDDAVLVLSELLSNSCRHASPLPEGSVVRASWRCDGHGAVSVSVTDGGGPTKPLPATPSVSARGGRGLAIIGALARDWGVEEGHEPDASGTSPVTVWAELVSRDAHPTGRRPVTGHGAGHSRHHHGRRRAVHAPAEAVEEIPFDVAAVEELR